MFRVAMSCSVLALCGVAGAATWTVDDDGSADFDNIQAAVDAASDGDEIVVEPGTYTGTGDEVVDTLGKAITIKASGTPEETIIDGEGARRVVQCAGGEGADTIIEGFTITGGFVTAEFQEGGGGIYCKQSSPTITDCTISNNTATYWGGGIYCNSSSPTISDCTISDNTATYDGGGIYCYYSSPTISGCTISGNTANNNGGGIRCSNSSSPTISGCTISENTADWGGGIFGSSNSSPTISGCTISGNTANNNGGGIYWQGGSPTLTDTSVCCNAPNQIVGGWADDDGNHVADECIDDCNCNDVSDIDDVADGTSFDCDQDLVPDECEPDCDGDGIIDDCDSEPDQDGNGVPDNCDPDCNENGIADGVDILNGWSDDCDDDLVPDECQLDDGSATDCDEDGTLDHCQITDDPDLDCDENGVLDSCELEPVLTQAAKLTADDGASGDKFGYSVATSDGIAVIGTGWDDDNGDGSGSAYVYEQQGDGTWQQVAKLTADDGASGDNFGNSVATSDGVAVIGARWDNSATGSAYVYEQQGDGTWQQVAKLTADDGASPDRFGISVALDDGVAVIGAYNDEDRWCCDFGSAYVYEQQGDGTWQQVAKLTADDGANNDLFGYSVATSDGIAVIGAYKEDDNGNDTGSAYVFEQQADSTWQQVAKLTADDGAAHDWFGYSVATSDGIAVIGAHYDDDNGTTSGSAYVYKQQADSAWQQVAKLTADDGAADDRFGWSVATSDGVAVIGAYGDDSDGSGSAYVYEQQGDGTWQQVAKLTADDGAIFDRFGSSVALDDGVAVIGANDDGYSGSAYVFETFSQADCDANGLMDDCEIEEDPSLDCDLDGVLDSCAVADGSVDDCNENGIPDSCDIADGGDADGDGYLDECECAADIAGPDGPGFPDGIVGTDDLLTVIGYWGSSQPNGDVNGDGIVGTDDLLAVIGAWGPCE